MPTPFLFAVGTSGFTTTPFTVLTTELNALADATLSTLGAAKSQSTTGSAIWGHVWFKSGGSFTPLSASPILSGWWITSTDGGTTFEKSSATPPRAPDFVIPLIAAAYAANDLVFAPGLVRLWAPSIKVLLLNSTGAALPATGNVLTIGPVEIAF